MRLPRPRLRHLPPLPQEGCDAMKRNSWSWRFLELIGTSGSSMIVEAASTEASKPRADQSRSLQPRAAIATDKPAGAEQAITET